MTFFLNDFDPGPIRISRLGFAYYVIEQSESVGTVTTTGTFYFMGGGFEVSSDPQRSGAGGATTWLFSYDGDGNRVSHLTTDNITTTGTFYFMGGGFEVSSDPQNSGAGGITQTVRKYYSIAGTTYAVSDNGTMNYLITDHLSSMVAVTDASGLLLDETRYMPFGSVRSDVGTISQTDKSFTGQKVLPDTGLLDYNARMYSSEIGRFTQPDTLIPGAGNSQAWNRYSYTLNNPIMFNDPSGHMQCEGILNCKGDEFDIAATPITDFFRKNRIISSGVSLVENLLDKRGKLPNNIGFSVHTVLPIELSGGMGTLEITVKTSGMKNIGRFGGLYSPISLIIGLGLSNFESQYENYYRQSTLQNVVSDLVIDNGGFWAGELAGAAAAASFAEFPVAAIVIGTSVDLLAGVVYDGLATKFNWQGNLEYWMLEHLHGTARDYSKPPYAIQTPSFEYRPSATPNFFQYPDLRSTRTPYDY